MTPALWYSMWRFSLAVMVAGCVGCNGAPRPMIQSTVDAWLNCEECRSGERDAVRALGQLAVPALAQALRNGPSNQLRDNMRQKFDAVYTRVEAATKVPPPPALAVSRATYVDRAVANFVATYQKRAAQALGDIGGPAAIAAFQFVLTSSTTAYRADVLDAVRVARALTDTARFRGSITPTRVNFGDTVEVRAPPYELFSGNEWAHINGFELPDSALVLMRTPDRFRFLAAGAAGEQVMTVHHVGTTTHSQYASVVIPTLSDPNDRAMATCTTMACRIAQAPRYSALRASFVSIHSLWRTKSSVDTMDLVVFEPSAPLHVNADLRWAGTVNLDLRWINCITFAPEGNLGGATLSNPEATAVDIPAGQCWALLVQLQTTGAVLPVAAALRLSP